MTADPPLVLDGEVAVRHLYISPAHNFRGHHGKPAGKNPTIEVDEVNCVPGQGLEGDRYFGHNDNFKGQITFFEWEVYRALVETMQVFDYEPDVFRRNVITEGIDLNTLIGKRFMLQGVEFEGSEECAPCYWMDQAFAPGTEEALKGKGGLRARILSPGPLRSDQE